ncbi:MAG TPA: biopolymer transporter TolR [Blastocatellia bacterium]|nr:biopolymer transporter TolR [Blastocatellia bacterium]
MLKSMFGRGSHQGGLAFVAVLVAISFSKPLPPASNAGTASLEIGVFESQTDVGNPVNAGGASYDANGQEYVVTGSGTNMWADRDEFRFVWRRMKGDFILTARARFASKGVEEHRKMGWIVRSSLDPGSAHVNSAVHGSGLTSLQFRRATGQPTEEVRSPVTAPDVIQLQRKGSQYKMMVARFGDPFQSVQISDVSLGDEVYVGIYVCSHNKDVVEKAVFSNVQIIVPAKDDFVPYRDYIGSNLEVMDVESGRRRIIYQSPDSLQAPNWTRDGEALIYNTKGKLYRFDLATKSPNLIDTDFATNNNNDHVLSFDGRLIAISHHSKDDQNKSIVYVVPVQGGRPKRITASGPSYLHGWSPDGRFLVYTGERNGEFDIYKIKVDGGDEVRLTSARGLDDGPEFTPDGRYIYFNSTRSGNMQIWRMKPDGSSQEQVTSDEFNNWFPHISPDGKWIVFLSFLSDVRADDHPFYKQVYLRLMPAAGGIAKTIAYVYGGQGTINVPSWSPDSRRIAFVSNSDMR